MTVRPTASALAVALVVMSTAACEGPREGQLLGSVASAPRPAVGGDFVLAEADRWKGDEPVTLGVAPTVGSDIVKQQIEPIARFIGDALGVEIRPVIADSYDDLIDRAVAGEIDIAWLPPLAYVKARGREPRMAPLVSLIKLGRSHYSAFILVKRRDPARELKDLRTRKVAYVDSSSTSGYLFPYAALVSAGVDPATDLEWLGAGSHVRAIHQLQTGEVDAAATCSGMMEIAGLADDAPPATALRILYKHGPIPYDSLCATTAVPERVHETLRGAFLTLHSHNPAARAALAADPQLTGFLPTRDADYDEVREVLARLPVPPKAAR